MAQILRLIQESGMTPADVLLAVAMGDTTEHLFRPSNSITFTEFLDAMADSCNGAGILEEWLSTSESGLLLAEEVVLGLHCECGEYCQM